MDPKKKALEIANLILEKKGTDLTVMELKGVSAVTDYQIICSAESERQVEAIAGHIEESLGKKKLHPLSFEGLGNWRWALLDYNDVIVHIFLSETRGFYDLDGLWVDAPRISPAREERAIKEKRR